MNQLPIIDQPVSAPKSENPEPPFSRGRYAFVSLGCPKNLVDSERMLGTLALDGYTLVSEPDGADFVIINTCGFIESARDESKSVIREMLELKRQGRTKGVIVAGCLPERLGGGLLKELPEIDHVVGVFGRDEISRVADRLMASGATGDSSASAFAAENGNHHAAVLPLANGGQAASGTQREQRELFRPAPIKALDDRARLRITPPHYAYLKISEGCDRTCTFCAIPKMRGKHVTKPMEMVLDEARELAADGVRELNIVAQDTTYYGLDLYGRVRLAELLRELEKIDGIDWIRLLYLYPIHFTDELIDTIAGSTKVLPYLDMPLQHINDTLLKRMQRRVNRAQTEELLGKLRERIPNLVLRTTFIVGFPGETEAQFDELCRFVQEAKFQRLGVFTYSYEPDTPATKLSDHLPEDVKQARRERLMALQQDIAFEFADSLVGYELDALIDEQIDEDLWLGRCFIDAPEIDANVYVAGSGLRVGDMVPVEIVERREYDLVGVATIEQAVSTNG